MAKKRDFEPGDHVAVVGGKLTKNDGVEEIKPSVKVGKVLYVGMTDMIVEESSWTYPSTFVAKKNRCSLVNVQPSFATPSIPEPAQLGDMVLHHKGTRFGREDEQACVGVLMEISQTPGSKPRGRILVADKLVEVELNDVIVLQRKGKK